MKYHVSLSLVLGAMFFAVSCGFLSFLDAPPEDAKLEYITFYVKTENLPTNKLDRFYVTDDKGAQIGAGAGYSANGKVALSIPSRFAGQELNVCTGYSIMTYATEKTTIAENMTVVITAENINVGVPGGVLPAIPNVVSPRKVTVTNNSGMGSYSVNDIYVSSFEGSRISTAAYDTTTKVWSLNMPDDFDNMKLRFWVDFKESGSPYCFYEDIVWRKDSPTNIAITYRGTPIKNYADLQRIAGSGHFVVTNAISVGAAPWVPIDTFQGTLHGGGYKITGIKFAQSPSAGSYGLFRKLTGNVSDLKLEYADTAPLVLSAWAPTVGGNFAMAGILAGEAAANSNIKNVMVSLAAGVSAFSVKSTVSGTNDVYVGGIVGYLNEGLLEQSYSGAGIELAAGSTTGPRYFMGGLAGMSKRQITASYARGRVSANNASLINGAVYAGGLTGGLNGTGSSTTIEKSYASGDILAVINNAGVTVNIGGLAGRIDGNYRINNSVAANETVTASDTGTVSVGSLIGSSQDIFGDNNKQKDPMHISGGTKYERQASASSLTTASDYQPMFSGSDNPWVWDNASGYPKLFWQQSSVDIFEKLDLSAFLGSFLGH